MTDLNLTGGGGMLFLNGLAWMAATSLTGPEWGPVFGGLLSTAGLVMAGLAQNRTNENNALGPEDLE